MFLPVVDLKPPYLDKVLFNLAVVQQKLGKTINMVVPPKVLIEFKEALVFALMGVLRMQNEVNILSTVTGARRDSTGGVLYKPN